VGGVGLDGWDSREAAYSNLVAENEPPFETLQKRMHIIINQRCGGIWGAYASDLKTLSQIRPKKGNMCL
jgi:hypothetical protein